MASRTVTDVAPRQLGEPLLPGLFWLRGRGLVERSASGVALGDGDVEADVTDLVKAVGQDVTDEPAQELDWMDGDGVAILCAKGDRVLRNVDQATVADADAMSVAPQILQDVFATIERRLGVDHPVFWKPSHQIRKGFRVIEV